MERSKIYQQQEEVTDDENMNTKSKPLPTNHPAMQKAKNAVKGHKTKGIRSEIQRPEQILKKREDKAKKAAKVAARAQKKKQKKNRR